MGVYWGANAALVAMIGLVVAPPWQTPGLFTGRSKRADDPHLDFGAVPDRELINIFEPHPRRIRQQVDSISTRFCPVAYPNPPLRGPVNETSGAAPGRIEGCDDYFAAVTAHNFNLVGYSSGAI